MKIDEARLLAKQYGVTSLDPIDRGLVGDWRMDRNTGLFCPDYSGYASHGVILGATWGSTDRGLALDCDGVDDYVTVPRGPHFDTDDITIEVLVRPNGVGTSSYVACQNDNANAASQSWGITQETTDWRFYTAEAGGPLGWDWDVISGTVAAGVWAHLVLTVRGVRCDGWVDAVQVAGGGDLAAVRTKSTSDLTIGTRTGATTWDFSGAIALVRFYNHALSADEILRRYKICLARGSGAPSVWMPQWSIPFVAGGPPPAGNPWYSYAQQM